MFPSAVAQVQVVSAGELDLQGHPLAVLGQRQLACHFGETNFRPFERVHRQIEHLGVLHQAILLRDNAHGHFVSAPDDQVSGQVHSAPVRRR
jgi:hypothetical protein